MTTANVNAATSHRRTIGVIVSLLVVAALLIVAALLVRGSNSVWARHNDAAPPSVPGGGLAPTGP